MISRRNCLGAALGLPGAALFAAPAHAAGGQLEEPLIDSVRSALSAAISQAAPPVA